MGRGRWLRRLQLRLHGTRPTPLVLGEHQARRWHAFLGLYLRGPRDVHPLYRGG